MNDNYTRAPHQNNVSGSTSPHAALLIDFDNVTMGIRSNLGAELRKFLNSDIIRGKVAVQRAYADWRRYPQYVVPLSEASIDLIYAPAYGSSKKNATDIRLAIDGLELVFTRPEIGTFILLSGDSDFSSLVLKLKEYGKYVIGVGMQESSSDLLVQNCDEYYSYSSLAGLVSVDEAETHHFDPWELAERSVEKMVERGDVMRSDRMKQVMLELDPNFDEKDLGFSKFNRFLSEASSRGILQLEGIGNGQYEVAPVDGGGSGPSSAEPAGGGESRGRRGGGRGRERERTGRSSPARRRGGQKERPEPGAPGAGAAVGSAEGLRAAYRLLSDVVDELSTEDEPVRDSEVKRRMLDRDGSFDEATLGFSKFSRFLRQAHDEGVVDLIKGPEGNYHLAPSGSGATLSGDGRHRSGRERPEAPSEPGRRGGRRGRSVRGEAGEREREPEREEEAPARTQEPGAGKKEEPRSAKEDEEPRAAEEDGEDRATERRAPTGILGRRGRRGRGRGRSAPGGDGGETASPVPGPVDGDAGEDGGTPESGAPEAGATRSAAPASGGSASAPAGLGRFRRGRRGGRPEPTSSTSAGTGDETPEAGGETTEAPEAASPEIDEIVTHMAESYPGVGRRTARKLVDEFGPRVLEVIDSEPERIEKLLPAHRADAVLSGRAEERAREDRPREA